MSNRETKESSDEEGNILQAGLSRFNIEEDYTFDEPATEGTIIRNLKALKKREE